MNRHRFLLAWLAVLVLVTSAGAVTASFIFLADLAHHAGWPYPAAWLLPLCIDALAAMALTLYLLTRDRVAGATAVCAIATSALGNAASHWYSTGALTPGWVIVGLVGAVPGVSLGLSIHLVARYVSRSPAWTTPPSGSAPATGGPSRSASSAATTTSPKLASPTAPAAAPSASLPDEEIAALIRRRGWQDVSTRQLGSLLRDEANIRVGQKRVGPLRDLARLNGTPVG